MKQTMDAKRVRVIVRSYAHLLVSSPHRKVVSSETNFLKRTTSAFCPGDNTCAAGMDVICWTHKFQSSFLFCTRDWFRVCVLARTKGDPPMLAGVGVGDFGQTTYKDWCFESIRVFLLNSDGHLRLQSKAHLQLIH